MPKSEGKQKLKRSWLLSTFYVRFVLILISPDQTAFPGRHVPTWPIDGPIWIKWFGEDSGILLTREPLLDS